MEIKDLIKSKRIEKGLTVYELGKLVGVSHTTISRWETGHISSMRSSKMVLLATALGISVTDLLKDDIKSEAIEYHRTSDIRLRYNYFIQELLSRKDGFTFDGKSLDAADIDMIVASLESHMEFIRKVINSKHK